MRRNTLIDEYAVFWGIVVGGLAVAHDLARRSGRGAVLAARLALALSFVVGHIAALPARLAWRYAHPEDRAAVLAAGRWVLSAACRLPGLAWAAVDILDRASMRAAFAAVDALEAVREEIDRARAPRRRPMTADEVAAWDRLLGYEPEPEPVACEERRAA